MVAALVASKVVSKVELMANPPFSISMPSVALLSKLELFARMVMMYDVTKELWKYSALIEEEEKEW